MKAEYGELRENDGEIRLLPESIDDLWHLQHIIGPGDLVFATTFRSVDAASDKIRRRRWRSARYGSGSGSSGWNSPSTVSGSGSRG